MTGPAAATSRDAETPPALRGAIGSLPYRLQMAGGWIDQPFVSSLNPEPPGSMVVVSLLPTVRYMDRCGMATGTRTAAQALWGDAFPAGRTAASLVRELYAVENANLAEPSGSQDMCGLVYPGISRLDYDASVDGGWFPAHVESNSDPEVVAWLERVLHLVPVMQRPPGYGPLGIKRLDPAWIARLGASGRACYDAIVAMDVRALGESLNECSRAWDAILPQVFEHPTITVDLQRPAGRLCRRLPGGDALRLRRRLRHRRLRDAPSRVLAHRGARVVTETTGGAPVIVEASLDNLRSDDVRFLQEAAALGPLHVRVPSDELVAHLTGAPPVFPAAERLFLAESLRWVDHAEVVDTGARAGARRP